MERIDDPYPWGSACLTPNYLDVQRATCYVRLGMAKDALRLWERILPQLPTSARRDVGVFRARQAQALAACGEPEQASYLATGVIELAEQTGSVRMRRELQALRERMKPWADQPPGRKLAERLGTLGGST